MSSRYYVSLRPRTDSFHPVHKEGCPFLSESENSVYLGSFDSDYEAEAEGKIIFQKSRSCPFCSKKSEIKSIADSVLSGIIQFAETEYKSEYRGLFCCVN